MKKTRWFCSLLMTLVLVLSSMSGLLTITASAAEVDAEPNEMITEEELNALAQELFPDEYNASVRTAQSGISACAGEVCVVNAETKSLSDTERITCLQMSDGLSAFAYTVSFPKNSVVNGGDYDIINCDIIYLVPGYIGSVYVHGLEYTLDYNGYDSLDEVGNDDHSEVKAVDSHHIPHESANGPAMVVYTSCFENVNIQGLNVYFYLYVYVGNNKLTYDLYHS